MKHIPYQVIILAAGKGTRLRYRAKPKVLAPVAGKPMIDHVMAQVEEIPWATKPIVVVGYRRTEPEQRLQGRAICAVQEEQKGTAHAVLAARDYVESPNIVVRYGDMPFISAASIQRLIDLHDQNQGTVSMSTVTVPDFRGERASLMSYGKIVRDARGRLLRITELKDASPAERKIHELNPGIYAFNAGWFFRNAARIGNTNVRGEYYLTDIVEIAIRDGVTVATVPIAPEEVIGINTKEELYIADRLLAEGELIGSL